MTEKVDVVICGGGSAGLTAAIWLSRFNIPFKLLERHSGALEVGQADGVQCRTVEIFEHLGILDPLLRESYHVMEVAFWSLDDNDVLKRKDVANDVELGLTHQPHVILNQARMNELMMEEVVRLLGDKSDPVVYNCEVEGVRLDSTDDEYPVEVATTCNGKPTTYRAKYAIVSCSPPISHPHSLTNITGLRRRPQHSPQIPRLHHGRRLNQFHLGRHGHLSPYRLSRHP